MQPRVWYETWFDTPAERGLLPARRGPAADLPGGTARRRIGHALMTLGAVLAAEPKPQSARQLPR